MKADFSDSVRDVEYEAIATASHEGLPATCLQRATLFLRKYPNDFGALYYSGKSLSSMARYSDAEEFLMRALAFCPDSRKDIVFNELGVLCRNRLHPVEAEAWFRKALQVRPRFAGNFIFLGSLLAVQGRLAEAEQCHTEALLCPEGPVDEAHLNIALILRAKEQYQEALSHVRAALAIDPSYKAATDLLEDLQRVLSHSAEA